MFHFQYIHGTAGLPDAELRWGEWGRGADVKAQMGTPKGMVDGPISYDTMGPGQSRSLQRHFRDAAGRQPGAGV